MTAPIVIERGEVSLSSRKEKISSFECSKEEVEGEMKRLETEFLSSGFKKEGDNFFSKRNDLFVLIKVISSPPPCPCVVK